ncbi:MAG: BolA family protein [Gammaproteobacteria bacterium]
MENQEIIDMIESGIEGAKVSVTGDGSHFDAVIVAAAFDGKNTLARQRMVFASLGDSITSGRLHNLNIKALTPAEAGDA